MLNRLKRTFFSFPASLEERQALINGENNTQEFQPVVKPEYKSTLFSSRVPNADCKMCPKCLMRTKMEREGYTKSQIAITLRKIK